MADNPLPFKKIVEKKVTELTKQELLKLAEKEKKAVLEGLKKLKKDAGTVAVVLGAAYVTFRFTRFLFGGSSRRRNRRRDYIQMPPPTIIYKNGTDTKSTILDTVIRKFTEIALDIVEEKLKEKISNIGKEDAK